MQIILTLIVIGISTTGIILASRASKKLRGIIDELKQQPPKIKVYFPDGTDKVSYPLQPKANEDDSIPITIYIENTGEETIMKADVSIYMDEKFVPKKLEYLGYTEEGDTLRILEKTPTPKDPYSPSVVKYVYTRSEFVIRKGETGKIVLSAQMPKIKKTYFLQVTLASNQGDGGIHPLNVAIN